MSRASRFLVLSLLLSLIIPAVAAAAVPIAKVRGLPLGTTVTIEGRVTVPSALFESASLEDQGFAVQDDTGGIYVRMDTDLGLHRNQQVRVTGTLGQSFNILFLDAQPAGVELLSSKPLLISTGEVGTATEGLIITVAGVVTIAVAPDLPFGWQFSVNDGSGDVAVFIHTSTGINPDEIPFLALGQRVRVTGFSSRFADEVELQPRFPDDIRPDH